MQYLSENLPVQAPKLLDKARGKIHLTRGVKGAIIALRRMGLNKNGVHCVLLTLH